MTGPVIPLPFEYPRVKAAWNERDVLLFAVSIGVEAKDGLHFLYEKHPKFQAFPTYPIVLTFKHDSPSTIDFLARNASAPLPPNCPPLNWSTAVDGGRRLIIYRPLPVSSDGNDRFEVRSRVLAVYDKGEGKGTVLEQEHCVVERETGEEFTRSYETAFFVGAGGWGGERGPKMQRCLPPNRQPDATATHQTTLESAHLYRLNGDYNPLHASPPAGQQLGYPGIIMHGLFSWNLAAVKVLQRYTADNDGSRLKDFQARFASPVRPGDRLEVFMWEMGKVEEGEGEGLVEVRFVVRVGEREVLRDGRALLDVGGEKARL